MSCNVVYDVAVDAGALRCCCAILIRDDCHDSIPGKNDD